MGVNKVILIGNLGAKPEVRYTSSGVPVARFRIATTERYGVDENGQRKEHTEWHSCTAWRKLAEICGQYLDKGTKVYIEGRIRSNEYTGKDGIARRGFEIHVDELQILSPKGQREFVPDEPASFSDFPETSAPVQSKTGHPATSKGTPAPTDDIDLEPNLDIDEDDFFTE